MSDFITILTSDWFWIAVGSLGAVTTLVFTYQQMKRADILASRDFLFKLVDKFCSYKMRKRRHDIMTIYKKDKTDFENMDKCRDVFDFFEDLGILLRKKAIPKEFVWSDYAYWIQGYWTAFKNYVDWAEKSADVNFYCEFQYLFKEILTYDELMRKPSVLPFFLRRGKPIEMQPKELEAFVDEEINLVVPLNRHFNLKVTNPTT